MAHSCDPFTLTFSMKLKYEAVCLGMISHGA